MNISLEGIPVNEFQESFQKYQHCLEKCINFTVAETSLILTAANSNQLNKMCISQEYSGNVIVNECVRDCMKANLD